MFEYWQFKVYRIKCRFKILNSLVKKLFGLNMYLLNVYAQTTDFKNWVRISAKKSGRENSFWRYYLRNTRAEIIS